MRPAACRRAELDNLPFETSFCRRCRGADPAGAQDEHRLTTAIAGSTHGRPEHTPAPATAAMAGCGVKLRSPPSSWRYKSAATWLLHKIDYQEEHNLRKLTGAAWSKAVCETPIAAMINSTPCATPCVDRCRAILYSAYA